MKPGPYVLDADAVSYLIEERPRVLVAFALALSEDPAIFSCPVVRYQILRGLLHRGARAKLARFHQLASALLDEAVGDADLFIAAFAINRGAALVTNNAAHFAHLPVSMESWLAPVPEQ